MTKRLIAVVLVLVTITSLTIPTALCDTGDRIRFIPTRIIVKSNSVKVEGYFVNLNTDKSVKNFREFKLYVYKDGDLLISGSFGTLQSFSVAALRTSYHTFTFNGSHNLRNGTYVCGDSYYCEFSCRFTSY